MNHSDAITLRRLTGLTRYRPSSAEDLQALLLQIVLAVMMVFMIAYFLFVGDQKKQRSEEIMAINRQKLTLALEQVAEDRRVAYGLNALMIQGVDGKRTFEPDSHFVDGRLALSPAALKALSQGSAAAFRDCRDEAGNLANWRTNVFAIAELDSSSLKPEESEWFEQALRESVESVRQDVRGVQRSLASRMIREWVANPASMPAADDPRELARELKARALKRVADEIGAEVLP